jgi:hypothetical protein
MASGALADVRVVEDDSYAGLCDPSLAAFVDQVCLVGRAHLREHMSEDEGPGRLHDVRWTC